MSAKLTKRKVIPIHAGMERGDAENAVVEWFNLHRTDLLRYAGRMLPASESAEDVVQEIFYRVLKQKNPLALENPKAFLMTMARNAVIDRLRKIRPTSEVGEQIEGNPGQQTLKHSEMLVAIEQGLRDLPERCRKVFILKRFHGKETAEIARIMGVSPRMVQKYIARAMSHFYERLT